MHGQRSIYERGADAMESSHNGPGMILVFFGAASLFQPRKQIPELPPDEERKAHAVRALEFGERD